jgi:hypothetical protein
VYLEIQKVVWYFLNESRRLEHLTSAVDNHIANVEALLCTCHCYIEKAPLLLLSVSGLKSKVSASQN